MPGMLCYFIKVKLQASHGTLWTASNLCHPPTGKGDPAGYEKHRPNRASYTTKGNGIGKRPSAA